MSTIPRAWLSFAAVGAGIIHLALALSAPPGIAAALAVIGGAQFAWGVLLVAIGRVQAPRAVIAAAMVPTTLWIVSVVVAGAAREPSATASLRFLPLVIATSLELVIAVVVARSLRAVHTTPPPARRLVIGIGAGAVLVSALTLTALAATDIPRVVAPSGTYTNDHNSH